MWMAEYIDKNRRDTSVVSPCPWTLFDELTMFLVLLRSEAMYVGVSVR